MLVQGIFFYVAFYYFIRFSLVARYPYTLRHWKHPNYFVLAALAFYAGATTRHTWAIAGGVLCLILGVLPFVRRSPSRASVLPGRQNES